MLHDGKFRVKLGLPDGNAFPTNPAPERADIFYRNDLDKIFRYDGGAWVAIFQGITAADVINVPAGGIVATDVQAAINELDGEKSGVAGCQGSSHPIANQVLNEAQTYTSGDLRDGTVVPSDALGLWMMLHGRAGVIGDELYIESADSVPDAYSSRIRVTTANVTFAELVMVRLGTGGNAGKVKILASRGNWIAIFAWPVGYWK